MHMVHSFSTMSVMFEVLTCIFNYFAGCVGLAVITVMFVTTCLMTLVIVIVWKQGIIKAIACLLLFGSIELLYISACICKVPEGGWISLVLCFIFNCIMYTWNYGTMKKHQFDVENKVSMNRMLSMGPSLGMVRVPGVGLMYSNLASGFPAMFGHFVTNLPAFHQVLVFVCVKSVQVPHAVKLNGWSSVGSVQRSLACFIALSGMVTRTFSRRNIILKTN